MSFLLDTDTCSYHVKHPSGLIHRIIQYSGGLYVSTITLAELYTWAYRRANPANLLKSLAADLLSDVSLVDFDATCAERFGIVRGSMLQTGVQVAVPDLMIAATALVHNLTLVTHNTADYKDVPGLRLDDWLVP